MDFYGKFLTLCSKRGISPSKAVMDIGLSKPAATRWKNGGLPSDSSLHRIALYFAVPVEYFFDEYVEEKPADDSDSELSEYLEELRGREEMKILFHSAKGATKEQIMAVAQMLEQFNK